MWSRTAHDLRPHTFDSRAPWGGVFGWGLLTLGFSKWSVRVRRPTRFTPRVFSETGHFLQRSVWSLWLDSGNGGREGNRGFQCLIRRSAGTFLVSFLQFQAHCWPGMDQLQLRFTVSAARSGTLAVLQGGGGPSPALARFCNTESTSGPGASLGFGRAPCPSHLSQVFLSAGT